MGSVKNGSNILSGYQRNKTHKKTLFQNSKIAFMLRQSWQKWHSINLPPPKKKWRFFFWGGGVSFLEYFHEFFGLGHKKNFGKTLGQSRCFGIIIGHFRPFYDFGKFKKSGIFSIFGQIWQLVFSKYDFGPNWSYDH